MRLNVYNVHVLIYLYDVAKFQFTFEVHLSGRDTDLS